MPKLRFRGGQEAVGSSNCITIENDTTQIMIDCGARIGDYNGGSKKNGSYPDFEGLDPEHLIILLTHGHDDHIRGLLALAKTFGRYPIPIYGSRFTLERVKWMLGMEKLKTRWVFHALRIGKTIIMPFHPTGKVSVRPLSIDHTIPEALAYDIWVGGQHLVHMGDFSNRSWQKMPPDLNPDILLLDSTGALEKSAPPKTAEITDNFRHIITTTKPRRKTIVACFSTNMDVWRMVTGIGRSVGKEIAPLGTSMEAMVGIAHRLYGYYPGALPGKIFDSDIYVVTGCQGEEGSALEYLLDQSILMRIHPGDTVVFAARAIPGNEECVEHFAERSLKLTGPSGRVITDPRSVNLPGVVQKRVTRSGHSNAPDLGNTIEHINPRIVIPIHGDFRRRDTLATIAIRFYHKSTVLVPDSGIYELHCL